MRNPTDSADLDLEEVLTDVVAGLDPVLPWLAAVVVLVMLLRFPMLGRGAGPFASQDPWRLFLYDARRGVMERAGGRCEGPLVLVWGRCAREAKEADHVYPWSRGGATVPSNGQALCRSCNRSKSNTRPAWWYIVGLERRRRAYFPPGAEVRVSAAMTPADRALRVGSQPSPRQSRRSTR